MTEGEQAAVILVLAVLVAVGGVAGVLISTKDMWLK